MARSLDNLINKFKASTKQAADQMSKAARVARIKMDIMTLTGERRKELQEIGASAHELYKSAQKIDGSSLVRTVADNLSNIERIDKRVEELEGEIKDLQQQMKHTNGAEADITDAEVTEVKPKDKDRSESGESASS